MLLNNVIMTTLKNGGGTYYHNGALYNSLSGGYGVALEGMEQQVLINDFNVSVLKKYIEQHKELLHKRGYFLGTWVHDGMVYLDISIIVPSENEAVRLGKKYKQHSVFNFKTFESIELVYEV